MSRYLVIREDGIICGTIEANSLLDVTWNKVQLVGDAKPKRAYRDKMIAEAMESPGKQVRLYCIEPAGT